MGLEARRVGCFEPAPATVFISCDQGKETVSGEGNKGRVAIVTGASSGIGLGATRALLERGYCVVGASRHISSSKDLEASDDLILVDGDVGKKESAVKISGSAIKHFGRIDLLVNCAG